MQYDLIIKGGTVIDPSAGTHARLDVAIVGDRIAAVEPTMSADLADDVIPVDDRYVVPGLIDLHTHVYAGATHGSVHADSVAATSGVTTFVDAGSAGAYGVPSLFNHIATTSSVRILSFVNISAIGLTAPTGELVRLDYCDSSLIRRVVDRFPGFVKGIKVRMGIPHAGYHGLAPLELAREAADDLALPLMVHIAYAPPSLQSVLSHMRHGDILTHCFTGLTMKILDESDALPDYVLRARERGVIFDLGHGTGSFNFDVAERAASLKFWPDTISTDLHQVSVNGPMFDLPTCMSKILHLGMTLDDVIAATTSRPSRMLGLDMEIGSVQPGYRADIAVLAVDNGEFPIFDSQLEHRQARRRLRATHTIANGNILDEGLAPLPAPWVNLSRAQEQYYRSDHTARGRPIVEVLAEANDFAVAIPKEVDPTEMLHDELSSYGCPTNNDSPSPTGRKDGDS